MTESGKPDLKQYWIFALRLQRGNHEPPPLSLCRKGRGIMSINHKRKNKFLWKTLKDGLVSTHGNHKWKIGKWDKVSAPLEICRKGFHASERILDAFFYVKPGCIARAEVRGESIDHGDKQCWPEMRIVKAWKWTKNDSVAMAVYAAELALHIYEKRYPHDKRPRNAIDAARR